MAAPAFFSPPPSPLQGDQPQFLDVSWLLEASEPRPGAGWTRYGTGIFLVIVVASAYFSNQDSEMAPMIRAVSSFLMFALLAAMAIVTWTTMRGQRMEQQQLAAIEDLIQLRRWQEAAAALQATLSQPARTLHGRVQALIFLSGVLGRYHRFADAITVQEYLMENIGMDGPTSHALQLGRAMAMLREDHLVDADRAITDLRRQAFRASDAKERASRLKLPDSDSDDASQDGSDELQSADASATSPDDPYQTPEVGFKRSPRTHESAGLALVELYRDVKTGHPAEAEAMFVEKLPILREQMGHRVADAYALVARAYDLLGRTSEAAAMYANATVLAPVGELQRRYPELAVMASKYPASPAPSPSTLNG